MYKSKQIYISKNIEMILTFLYFSKYNNIMIAINIKDRSEVANPSYEKPDIQLAAMFKALGDPTRLQIFEFLRACSTPIALDDSGDIRPVNGPTVGEVCCSVTGIEKITSTLSHHLKELRLAGLITMERHGKNMICSIVPEAVELLADYLKPNNTKEDTCSDNCCKPL